jgi:hypothetical protein
MKVIQKCKIERLSYTSRCGTEIADEFYVMQGDYSTTAAAIKALAYEIIIGVPWRKYEVAYSSPIELLKYFSEYIDYDELSNRLLKSEIYKKTIGENEKKLSRKYARIVLKREVEDVERHNEWVKNSIEELKSGKPVLVGSPLFYATYESLTAMIRKKPTKKTLNFDAKNEIKSRVDEELARLVAEQL